MATVTPLSDLSQEPDISQTALPEVLVPRDREKKWIKIATKWESYSAKNPKKLKRKIRKHGIPANMRSIIWPLLTGSDKLKQENPNLYAELLSRRDTCESAHIISLDVPRTFPEIPQFSGRESIGQQRLTDVLTAFAIFRPEVGYCQGMSFVTGAILLQGLSNEDAFWLLVAIVDQYVPGYYVPSMQQVRTDMKAVGVLMKRRYSSIMDHLTYHDISMEMVLPRFLICLFGRSGIPFPLVFRIWDCLFSEGTKILFRASLALFLINKDKLLKMDSIDQLMAFLQAPELHDADRFLKCMFKLPLSWQSVQNARAASNAH